VNLGTIRAALGVETGWSCGSCGLLFLIATIPRWQGPRRYEPIIIEDKYILTIDSNVVLPAMPYPATIEIPPDTTGEFRSRDALGFCLCRHTFTGTSRNAELFAAAMTGVVSHISHVIQTVSVHVPAGSPPSPARRHRRARASAPSRRSPRPGPHRGSRSIQRKMYG
jgi:hypothetical protein